MYLSGGICTTHGPGASQHWRPKKRTTPGPRGERTYREYYYVCDIGPRGRGVLRQSRLSSFVNATQEDRIGQDDTRTRGTSTPTVGKH